MLDLNDSIGPSSNADIEVEDMVGNVTHYMLKVEKDSKYSLDNLRTRLR